MQKGMAEDARGQGRVRLAAVKRQAFFLKAASTLDSF